MSTPAPDDLAPLATSSDSLEGLYAKGQAFAGFLATVKSRRETWLANYAGATLASALLERAKAVPGHWRLLVVAEDWCGDSANTIPYLARLIDSVPSLELRVVSSRDGRWVMERHRTPDGRAATPTIVLLDSAGTDVGCFVERPAPLREWLAFNRARLSERELQRGWDEWRRKDAGQSTVLEIVELLESAARRAVGLHRESEEGFHGSSAPYYRDRNPQLPDGGSGGGPGRRHHSEKHPAQYTGWRRPGNRPGQAQPAL